MRKRNSFLIASLLLLNAGWLAAGQFSFGPDSKTLKTLELKGLTIAKEAKDHYYLELKKETKIQSDLILDFENSKASALRDKNNHYRIISSSYNTGVTDPPQGKHYASFSGKHTLIRIATDKNKILGTHYFKEDFYISFYLKTGNSEDNSMIMSKEFITSGRIFGFSFKLKNGYLQTELNNLFYFNNKTKSILLKSDKKISPDKWHLATLYIDSNSGSATLYLDSIETASKQISTNNDEAYASGFHQHDTTPLTIGNEFYGSLDMIVVAPGKPDFEALSQKYSQASYNDYTKIPAQGSGQAVSAVLKTKFSHSVPLALKEKSETPAGTTIEHYVRFSEELFLKDDRSPEWIPLDKFNTLAKKNDFQYFQYMVRMKSSYNGTITPKLASARLAYFETKPPVAPSGLRITRTDNDKMETCISWNSNHEGNVKNGGGYIIHYGVSPDRMVASLYINETGGSITGLKQGESLLQNYKALSLCINNDLIAKNSEFEPDKSLLTFKKGITYYFKISSFNNKFDRYKSPDQKSEPSPTVNTAFRSM